jgi:hypothetical protein
VVALAKRAQHLVVDANLGHARNSLLPLIVRELANSGGHDGHKKLEVVHASLWAAAIADFQPIGSVEYDLPTGRWVHRYH